MPPPTPARDDHEAALAPAHSHFRYLRRQPFQFPEGQTGDVLDLGHVAAGLHINPAPGVSRVALPMQQVQQVGDLALLSFFHVRCAVCPF